MKHFLYTSLLMAICLIGNIQTAHAQKKVTKRPTVTKKAPTSEELLHQAEDYYDGTNGVFMNREKATELFRKAADMGNAKAQKWMYAILNETETNYPEAMKYLRMAAEQNDADAMFELGRCYNKGWCGLKEDSEQSLYWFRLAAERNSPQALRMLGIIYHEGYCNVTVDKEAAFRYLKQAADLDDELACGLISLTYEKGDGVATDTKKAIYYAKKGADLGDANSQYSYGGFLMEGADGLEKNEKLAFDYFMKSAEQGKNYAILAVAEFYLRGWGGLTQSKEEAKKWYVKASEAGSATASLMIADFCCDNDNERLSWYQKAAEQGDITGQAELAWANCTGKIANYDTRAGARELMKLMKTGNPRVIYYFAELRLQGGCGMPKNKKIAKELFESIKDSDDEVASFGASFNLAKMK
ncbi:tetratricopeptide repeat protein [Xylanibacter caecicola]|uniref:tetratricopeptide repeat protein n=1 Tax=Xylanibacter caecicola TaxID=2736294 RepID=UPI00258E0A9F|nr:hypothetical protein [Xylanibacter caecicola]